MKKKSSYCGARKARAHHRPPLPHRTKNEKRKELTGVFHGSRRGFGFVTPDAGEGEDVFIPADRTHGAYDGDVVRISYLHRFEGKTEGRVEEILQKNDTALIGTLFAHHRRGRKNAKSEYFVMPQSRRYPESLPITDVADAEEGDLIAFRILRGRFPVATFLSSFGCAGSFDANYEAILAEHAIAVDFEPDALREAEASAFDTHARERIELPVLTIDGEDAKDLDDAVSLTSDGEDGYLLFVHIADVSAYVRPKSALDRAAHKRGTSLYFVDAVVPMLPPALSNGSCSLHPGEDKLTLTAKMHLSPNGTLLSTALARTVIRSDVRGVYSEVNDLFQNGENSPYREKYAPVLDMIMKMRELYRKRYELARQRGYLTLDSAEPRFVLDETGAPVDILPRERGEAEELIEHFMLTANEGVARLLTKHECPCVYRVHALPPADKLASFAAYAASLGLDVSSLTADPITPHALGALLEEAEQKGKRSALSYPLLRAMSRAVYSDRREDHFGLALTHYCHFTSPIRRLSDLVTHRILKAVLLDGEAKEKHRSAAHRAAAAATEGEIRATEAERDIELLYKALWAEKHVGECFDATLTGVRPFGIFATLPNTVEGFVREESLPYGSVLDEEHLTAAVGGILLPLASSLRVRIEEVALSERKIYLSILINETKDMQGDLRS